MIPENRIPTRPGAFPSQEFPAPLGMVAVAGDYPRIPLGRPGALSLVRDIANPAIS